MGLSENGLNPEKTNGFADHYPYYSWLFHWGYTPFSDIPIFLPYSGWMVHLSNFLDGCWESSYLGLGHLNWDGHRDDPRMTMTGSDRP